MRKMNEKEEMFNTPIGVIYYLYSLFSTFALVILFIFSIFSDDVNIFKVIIFVILVLIIERLLYSILERQKVNKVKYRIQEIKKYIYVKNKRKKVVYYQIQELIKGIFGKDRWLPYSLKFGQRIERIEYENKDKAKDFLENLKKI